jgi:hypothetical protein
MPAEHLETVGPLGPRRRWLRALAALLLAMLAALLASTALLWTLLTAPAPSVSSTLPLAPGQAHQAVAWLRDMAVNWAGAAQRVAAAPGAEADAGAGAASGAGTHLLAADTLQAVTQDAAARLLGPGVATALTLADGRADLALSLPLHAVPRWGGVLSAGQARWLNVSARVQQVPGGRLPQLQVLRLGRVAVPTGPQAQALARWLVRQLGWQPRANRVALAARAVQQVGLSPQGLRLQLVPPLFLGHQLGPLLLPGVPLERLQPFCQRLAQLLGSRPPQQPVPLHALLQPALALAVQAAGGAAGAAAGVGAGATAGAAAAPAPAQGPALAQQLQLATLATTLLAARLPPVLLAPGVQCPLPSQHTVELGGRHDHALHFLLSALLAQGGHPLLADAVGLYNELSDVGDPRGSGFSFDDLAADRAGTEFGRLSRQAPQQLVQRLPQLRSDAFLMPSVQGLPGPLNAQQLKDQLGGVGSPRYQAWMAEVERRVQALPMLGR